MGGRMATLDEAERSKSGEDADWLEGWPEVGLRDLDAFDPAHAAQLRNHIIEADIRPDISEALGLDFSDLRGRGHPLRHEEVDNSNKGEYVALTVKRVLFGQRRAHLRALWKGFHAGVGGRTLDTQLSQMSAEDLSYVHLFNGYRDTFIY